MFGKLITIGTLLLTGLDFVFAQEVPEEEAIAAAITEAFPTRNCFENKVRVSAIVRLGDAVKVGIVDTATRASYLVNPGEKAGDVEVVSADYEKNEVVLRLGEELCSLSLAADPDAPVFTVKPEDMSLYHGEAIEQFLREFPDAIEQGLIKFPLQVFPPAEGKGATIEEFLKNNPELAKDIDLEPVGKGKGIEEFLENNPEINDEVPTETGSGLGPGIEEALRNNPIVITNQIPTPQDEPHEIK